ncbi:hypothetical protein CSOJ01_07792 [Colletotrichum sojae]|uniref:NACHT domain-containing protein n=1 Tax=Colletotrichum sojae TaxID=2175907 RepID=A0A8H6MT45_9PEZI|nr:hypothetical protein CSOJ01_07792 [Colletotrichum sojae]
MSVDNGSPSFLAGTAAGSPPLPAPPDNDLSRARAPSLGLLRNQLGKLSVRFFRSSRSNSSVQLPSAADIKGSLGLNLLHEPSEPAVDFVFAYLLATRDPIYEAIGKRIHAMYFLGTPHRGADSASLAKLVRQSAGYGPKAFLDDLVPGSGTLDSSQSQLLDPSTGISDYDRRNGGWQSHMKKVAALLRIDQRPDAILLATKEKQHYGSCRWLTEHNTFQEWVDNPADNEWVDGSMEDSGVSSPLPGPPKERVSKILWLNGRPGTGKTVAAGHVVRYLQSCNLDCSFYFFSHEDKPSSTVSVFLRSVAFQMADSNFEVRRVLLSMAEDDITIRHDDHHMLWTSLFVERIFRVERARPQFWVIDAIDECSKGLQALVSMLSNIDCRFPARILLTSRPGGQVGRNLVLERTRFAEIVTGGEGSLKDIELFLKARCLQAGDKSYQEMQGLVADVLAKSNGSFLWASLTTSNLEKAYSIEDKQYIIRQIPPEMDKLYSRILAFIIDSPSSDLAKCVLKWTICSPKSLHVRELAEAAKLDVGKTLTAGGRELETMTGHLIVVDSQSHIRIAHQTAAAFLSQSREEGFWIDHVAAHSRMAEICLKLLCGAEFAPPRTRRGGATARAANLSPLSDYASLNFSYHLVQGSSTNETLLVLLNKFLGSNILTWIERRAVAGSLDSMQVTAQRLKRYLGCRAKYQSPVSLESQTVTRWAKDLHHILAEFHSVLLEAPSSIHFLIPHFCPPHSMTAGLFAKSRKRLRIAGPREEDWGDRLSGYWFPEEACAVACSSRFLAVGLSNGEIRVSHLAGSETFHSAATLMHGKRVRLLGFNRASSLLVSCSARKLQLWKTRGSQTPEMPCLWSQNIDFTPGSMIFDPREQHIVLTDPQKSAIIFYSVTNGHRAEPVLLHAPSDSDSSDESGKLQASWTPSVQIRLDPDHKLAALAYRNALVSVWDLTETEKLGDLEKEGFEGGYSCPPVLDMVFNPIAELETLAISYKNGDVITCNPWTQEQTNTHHLPMSLSVLAATSDGRVLGGAADDGIIYLFLFETLQPIHRVGRPDDQLIVRGLTFSVDNSRFFDIRGQSCNVWAPFVLAPEDGLDDSCSEPFCEETILPEATTSHAHATQWGEAITAVEPAEDKFLLVGRQDGTIDICELSTANVVERFRLHSAFTEIQSLSWNAGKSTLLSVDVSGRHVVTRISSTGKGSGAQTTCLLDRRDSGRALQAILSPNAESVLVCTNSSTKVVGMDGSIVGEEKDLKGAWWIQHPSNPSHLIACRENDLQIFEWPTLTRISQAIRTSTLDAQSSLSTASLHPWISNAGSAYIARGLASSHNRVSSILAVEVSRITTFPAYLNRGCWSSAAHASTLKFAYTFDPTSSAVYNNDYTQHTCTTYIYIPALVPMAADLDNSVALINLTVTSYLIVAGIAPAFMGSYGAATNAAPSFGPVIAGVLAQQSWRWIFWFLVILTGAYLLVVFTLLPETQRKIVGNGSVKPSRAHKSLFDFFTRDRQTIVDDRRPMIAGEGGSYHIPNPFKCVVMLFSKGNFTVILIGSITYTVKMTLQSSLAAQCIDVYSLNYLQSGLIYLPSGVGGAIASFTTGKLLDRNIRKISVRQGRDATYRRGDDISDFPIEEARLNGIYGLVALSAVTTAGYGISLMQEAHIAVPLVMQFISGAATSSIFTVTSPLQY